MGVPVAGFGLVRRLTSVGGLLLVAMAAALASLAAPASAEPDYPPDFCQISATSFVVARGGSVAFTAEPFKPGSTVSIVVRAGGDVVQRASAVADADGVVAKKLTFTVLGRNTVTFSAPPVAQAGWCNGYPGPSTDVTVTGGDSGGADPDDSDDTGSLGGLPRTGAQVLGGLLLGGLLVGGGVLLVSASRKRRHA